MKTLFLIVTMILLAGCTNISQVNEARINLLVEENRALKEQVEQQTEMQNQVNAVIVEKVNELIIIQHRTIKEIERTRYELNQHFL